MKLLVYLTPAVHYLRWTSDLGSQRAFASQSMQEFRGLQIPAGTLFKAKKSRARCPLFGGSTCRTSQLWETTAAKTSPGEMGLSSDQDGSAAWGFWNEGLEQMHPRVYSPLSFKFHSSPCYHPPLPPTPPPRMSALFKHRSADHVLAGVHQQTPGKAQPFSEVADSVNMA